MHTQTPNHSTPLSPTPRRTLPDIRYNIVREPLSIFFVFNSRKQKTSLMSLHFFFWPAGCCCAVLTPVYGSAATNECRSYEQILGSASHLHVYTYACACVLFKRVFNVKIMMQQRIYGVTINWLSLFLIKRHDLFSNLIINRKGTRICTNIYATQCWWDLYFLCRNILQRSVGGEMF